MDEGSESPEYRLSPRYIARLEGWGMAVHSFSYRYQPKTIDRIKDVFALARETGRFVALRGAGKSYGDASILDNGIVLDLSQMNQILDWDPDTGIVAVEPGVTLQDLWRRVVPFGYWPPVVSGTMYTTVGGCAAMNIHGKNNFNMGPFGDHIIEFDLLLPSGKIHTCTRTRNADLFYGAISGFGMLGCFTRIVLKMKPVHSGLLRVEAFDTRNIGEMVDEFEERAPVSDYLVGWIDCTAGGDSLGRGIVHQAHYLEPGEDPRPLDSLNVGAQELPDKIAGLFPKSMVHYLMRPFINNLGMRLINAAKFRSSKLQPHGHLYYQSHGAFAFLLDYVPNWKRAYSPGGLIQYQSFIPKANAVGAFEEMLHLSQKAGLPPYLGVFKKHRPDDFLLTHAVDGYSLALDYRVTMKNREKLWALAEDLDRVVLENDGRFYFAKDATLRPEVLLRFFGEETLGKFIRLKRQCDPENILQTNLSKRLLEPYMA